MRTKTSTFLKFVCMIGFTASLTVSASSQSPEPMALIKHPLDGAAILPLIHTPEGVLFQVFAPNAHKIYIAGSFNGWAKSDGREVHETSAQMNGPDSGMVFSYFAPLAPGEHQFKFCVDGRADGWMKSPDSLESRMSDFDRLPGQEQVGPSSLFIFQRGAPPWVETVSCKDLVPELIQLSNPTTSAKGWAMRVKIHKPEARSVSITGSFDGWRGLENGRPIAAAAQPLLQSTEKKGVWYGDIPLTNSGSVEYVFIIDGRSILNDPCLLDVTEKNATQVGVVPLPNGELTLVYHRRFSDDEMSEKISQLAAGPTNAIWTTELNMALLSARASNQKILWVITQPGSRLSRELMKKLKHDPEIQLLLNQMTCLETPINQVRDIVDSKGIYRVPHVILMDSELKEDFEGFNPSTNDLKQRILSMQ